MKIKLLPWITALLMASSPFIYAQTANGDDSSPERSNMLLTGYGVANFVNAENSSSNFNSTFNPIFLWKVNNKIFFESEVEFELEEGATNIGLEYAHLVYVFNDYLTVGAGKFLNPGNIFMERLHPAWINKLPTMPLGLSEHGGVPLLAGSQIGVQARGAFDAGAGQITYAAYVTNGPTLNVEAADSGMTEGMAFNKSGEGDEHGHGGGGNGTLNFDNSEDNNDGKAIGGRIAIVPVAQFEIGYGVETAKVGAAGTPYSDVRSLVNAVDLAFTRDVSALKGRIDIRGQYVWLNIDNPDVHPLEFENHSNAGYGQLAYQLSGVDNDFFKNVEFVGRYDRLDLPAEAPVNIDQKRITAGINYWFSPSTVVKFAFESKKSTHEDESETDNTFISQFSIGF